MNTGHCTKEETLGIKKKVTEVVFKAVGKLLKQKNDIKILNLWVCQLSFLYLAPTVK